MKLISRGTAAVVTLGVTAALGVAVAPSAAAHGLMINPGSRTYLCYKDGLTSGGDLKPKNAACAAAVASGGTTPLYNWFGVLRSDAAGQTTGYIPDGKLCSGGNTTFAAYDAARADWPATRLTAGATIEFDWSNWAAHPGTFYLYVTKDGYDPTKPLKWSDLDAPFLTVKDPPQKGAVGSLEGHYYWTGKLPSNKSGRHMLYGRWVRSDSKENFFNCSDVVFDGGSGQVTGLGDSGSAAAGTDSGTNSGTNSGSNAVAAAPAAGHDHAVAADGCTATYSTVSSWDGGFQGAVTVSNPSGGAWSVNLALTGGGTVRTLWGGNATAGSTSTTVAAAAYNATSTSATLGFLGSGSAGAQVSCTPA